MNLKNLSDRLIENQLKDLSKEKLRRKNLAQAIEEIKEILKRRKIDREDLDLNSLVKRNSKARRKPGKLETKGPVKPKYFSQDGTEKWSGRGRAPRWVKSICADENLQLKEFKLLEVYQKPPNGNDSTDPKEK